jgi:predicted nuclease of predicted toxin-antitoxin system
VKFKLDENLGRTAFLAFEAAGHDVSTVHLQRMSGAPDNTVFAVCRDEGRILVTLDLDFANPLTFDPRTAAGVAVLRLPKNHAPSDISVVVQRLLAELGSRSMAGALWIVRADRIRTWKPVTEF